MEDIASSKNCEEDDDESNEESPIFVRQYSIVKSILEKLPISDLLSSSKVCGVWLEIGRVVRKQRRNKAQTLLWHPYGEHTTEVFEFYNGHSVSGPVNHFMLTDAPTRGFPTVEELTQEQSWSPLFPQMRGWITRQFKSAYWEPQLLVIVATASVDEYFASDEDNVTRLKIILSEIPRAIPCLITFSYGIVASVLNEPKSLEMENAEVPILAGLTIPKVPGLRVKMLTFTKETNTLYKGKVDGENCKTILNIEPEDNVKGILLFHTDVRKAGALKDAVFQYIKDQPHVALGGGAHYKNLASVCEGDCVPIGAGLIICGDENVKVASIGLFDSKISKRNEEKLLELKGCEFPEGESFAFMFACNGRGAHMHGGRTSVESTLFRKHFPKTNLIGTFTGGEYCHEVVPSRDAPPPPKKPSNIEFAYTTVFVFVSYKYPK